LPQNVTELQLISHIMYHIKALSNSANLQASWLSSNAFCFFVSGFQPCFTAFCRLCLSLVLLGASSNFRQRKRLVGLPPCCSDGDSTMDSSAFSFGICDRHNRFRYMSSTAVEGLRCLILAGSAMGTLAGSAMGTFSEACEFAVHRRWGRPLVMFTRLESVNTMYCKTLQYLYN